MGDVAFIVQVPGTNVLYQGAKRKHLLAFSFSGFAPS
jgi:hypothetical protein